MFWGTNNFPKFSFEVSNCDQKRIFINSVVMHLKQLFLNLIKSLIFSASEDSEWRVVKWMFKILGQKQDPSMNFINCWPWSVDFSCLLISTERLISLQMCLMLLKSKSWIFLILLYFWICLEHSNEMKLLFKQFLKSKVSGLKTW